MTYVSQPPIPHGRWPCSALSPVLNCHQGEGGPHISTPQGDLCEMATFQLNILDGTVHQGHLCAHHGLFAFRILFHQTFHKKVEYWYWMVAIILVVSPIHHLSMETNQHLYWSPTGLLTAIRGSQIFTLMFICEYFRPQGRIKHWHCLLTKGKY